MASTQSGPSRSDIDFRLLIPPAGVASLIGLCKASQNFLVIKTIYLKTETVITQIIQFLCFLYIN